MQRSSSEFDQRSASRWPTQLFIVVGVLTLILLGSALYQRIMNPSSGMITTDALAEKILREKTTRVVNTIRDSLGQELETDNCLVLNDICLACIDQFEITFVIEMTKNVGTNRVPFDLVIAGELDENDRHPSARRSKCEYPGSWDQVEGRVYSDLGRANEISYPAYSFWE